MTFLLRQDMSPKVWAVRARDDLPFETFCRGEPLLDAPEGSIRFELTEHEVRSDLLEFPYFVVSTPLKVAFDDYGVDNIAWYPATLVEPGGVEHEAWLGNILNPPAPTERKLTKKKKAKSFAAHRRRLSLDSNAELSRPANRKQLIAISDALKEHLEARDLEGLVFQDPSSYSGDPVSSFWDND